MLECEVGVQDALRWGNDVISLSEGLSPKTWRVRHTLVDWVRRLWNSRSGSMPASLRGFRRAAILYSGLGAICAYAPFERLPLVS